MSVELDFISRGKEYRIIRDKNKSKSVSRLLTKTSSDSEFMSLCSGEREVSDNVQAILDMDANLFLNAIYVRQGEIAELVDKQPADKKRLIGKLLGLDSLETAWKNLSPLINEYENKSSEISDDKFERELFGNFDENIKIIESNLNIDVLLREGHIVLIGQSKNIDRALEFLNELYKNFKSGKTLDKQSIVYAIELLKEGKEEIILKLYESGMTPEEISKRLKTDLEKIKKIINK